MDKLFYKAIIKKMPVGYALHKIILDEVGQPCDFEFIDANPAYEAATGLTIVTILGKRVTEVLPGIKKDEYDWIKEYGKVALQGLEMEFEQYSEKFAKWYRVCTFSPEKSYFITLITDITKDKKDLHQVLDSKNKFKSYIESAPYGIFIADRNGSYVAVNSEACEITGYTENELLNMRIPDLLPDSSKELGTKLFERVFCQGKVVTELQYKTKKGDIRWWTVATREISSDSLIGYCQDTNDRKSFEEGLIKSERLYRTFIDASEDMIYLKDDQFRYVIVNKALTVFLHREMDDVVGKSEFDLFPQEAAERFWQTDQKVQLLNTTMITEEKLDDKIYEIVKFPVPLGNDKTGIGAYIRDITVLKEQDYKIKKALERHRIIAETLIRSFESRQQQLDFALHEVLKMTESEYGYIYLYDEEKNEFTLNSWTNGVMETCKIVEKQTKYMLDKTGIWGEVVRQRHPIVVNDFAKINSLKKGYPEGHVILKNFMSIPIFIDEKIVAVVGLANKPSDYDDNEVFETTMLMNGVWMAVEKREAQIRTENLLKQTQSMFNEHEAMMLLIDPISGKIIDANPSAIDFYGYTKDEFLSLYIQDINTLTKEELEPLGLKALQKKQNYFSFKHRLKKGEIRTLDVYSCPISYNGEKILFSINFDATEREKAFEEIKYISYHDHLTSLYSRRFFDEELKRLDVEEHMPLTVLMADVNGLKLVNDSFGHSEGDMLLKKVAEIIKNGCRQNDIVARIGGDEFGIILPNTDDIEAQKIIMRIKSIEAMTKTKHLVLSISFGYAVKQSTQIEMGLIFSEAENNMYRNKMYESASMRNKTIDIIMNTLFEKSEREMKHSNRVSEIGVTIATAMGFTSDHVNKIRVACLLHDIGKIGIDEKILNKCGPLNKNDWEEIKKHPQTGRRILINSDEFSELAGFIFYHHEYWNGMGYPQGIMREDIPLESRIIAVADAYDAMTMDRSYRKGMSKEDAMAEIERNSGTQFDPKIVELFLKVLLKNNDF